MSNLDYVYEAVNCILSDDIDFWNRLNKYTDDNLILINVERNILEKLVTDAVSLRRAVLHSLSLIKEKGTTMKAEYYDIIVHALNDDIKQWEDLMNHYGESSVSKSEEKKKLREMAESNMISRKRALDYFKQEVTRED